MRKYNANLITLIRIIGVSFIFLLVPFKTLFAQQLALIFFAALAGTDGIDGRIARSKWGSVTNLGKILDPMADKLLTLVYLPLIEMHQISSGPVAIILARDVIISTIRIFAMQQGEVMAAKFTGKLRTAFSLPLVAVLLCRPIVDPTTAMSVPFIGHGIAGAISIVQGLPQPLITAAIWLLVAISVASVFEYSRFLFSWKRFQLLIA